MSSSPLPAAQDRSRKPAWRVVPSDSASHQSCCPLLVAPSCDLVSPPQHSPAFHESLFQLSRQAPVFFFLLLWWLWLWCLKLLLQYLLSSMLCLLLLIQCLWRPPVLLSAILFTLLLFFCVEYYRNSCDSCGCGCCSCCGCGGDQNISQDILMFSSDGLQLSVNLSNQIITTANMNM